MRKTLIALACLPVAVVAMASPRAAYADPTTHYQPSVMSKTRSGYSETQLDVNRLRVVFTGEPGTERQVIDDNLLYRAADVTLQRGFDYFVVVEHYVDEDAVTVSKRPPGPPLLPGRKTEQTRYVASSEIIMFRGTRSSDQPDAYDARTTMANLRARITHT